MFSDMADQEPPVHIIIPGKRRAEILPHFFENHAESDMERLADIGIIGDEADGFFAGE